MRPALSFHADAQTQLSAAKASGLTQLTLTQKDPKHGSITHTYEIDLVAMTQKNTNSGTERKIRGPW